MDDGLKQRLIGAIVLVALGVIFIPSLLNEEGRREIDVATQVPSEPVVMPRPLEIPDPIPPENIPPPNNADENYAHIVDAATIDSVVDDNTVAVETPVNAVEQISGLNEDGVPRAWSIQVSSFESEKNAVAFEQRLKDAGYRAYIQSNTANDIAVYRVFVGPKINRQVALDTKSEIDKAYKTQAMLVEFKP